MTTLFTYFFRIPFTMPLPNCDGFAVGKILLKSTATISGWKSQLSKVGLFYRAIIKNELFYSAEYGRVKTRNSYTVAYIEENMIKYGLVQYFLLFNTQALAAVKPLQLVRTAQAQFRVCVEVLDSIFFPVAVVDSLCFIPVNSIVSKQLFINFDSCDAYVVVFPTCVHISCDDYLSFCQIYLLREYYIQLKRGANSTREC